MPGNFAPAGQEFFAKFGIASTVCDIPLAGRHDLKWFVTLFEKFDGMGDRFWFTDHVTGFFENFHHALLGGEAGGAGNCGKAFFAFTGGDPRRGL